MPDLIDDLRHVVGSDHVLSDPGLRASYETDWTRRWHGESLCVVRPASTSEVAGIVTACAAAAVPIVPQGGNTGLAGGSVPGGGLPVIVSLRRLTEMSDVNPTSGQVTVSAGCILEAVQQTAAGNGWEVGIDLASRASATIGGMIATNAGGTRVLRNGMMRRRVVGVEAVLATGEVVRSMRGLGKDNTGYDLIGLMCGSEGTLGIVTGAILQLVPARTHRMVALIGLESLETAVETLTSLRPMLPSLDAVEYLSAECMDLVCSHAGLAPPLTRPHGAYLVLECAGSIDPAPEMAAALAALDSVAVGDDSVTRERLWAYRESLTESISGRGIPRKLDLTLPLDRMAAFESALQALVTERAADAEVFMFGHLGDGGLHVNIVTAADPDDLSLDEAVLRLAAESGGSVSAEHGIGRAKVPFLGFGRSETEIATMRRIKRALDPAGILNPGVIFPR